ncbi:MAG: chorismate synthase [Deltaproteobacteria bacterium]|nr:chorismate synthase [Deltaproteobacteria bacterium]
MPGNSFGKIFRITTFGESHGKAIGVVIDGCPPMLPIDESMIQEMMDRRRPGSGRASSPRKEEDLVTIYSGVFKGMTTGTPIMIMIENRDADSSAYKKNSALFRPGHGDITYQARYGIRDFRGGGRASARETAARVAAGAVANQFLAQQDIKVTAYTTALGGIQAKKIDPDSMSANPYLLADPDIVSEVDARVMDAVKAGDSLGGIVEIIAKGVPAGLGEPVFDKLDADLAGALMSIGAVKGVEIGSGFESAAMKGSVHNDPILPFGFGSNNAGGILAGISNGDEIKARVAVKPIPSISIQQSTIDENGKPAVISTTGRHDICAIPRINVVCEAMVCLVLTDHLLRFRAM